MDPYIELRVLMARKDWDAAQLASELGVSRPTAYRWCRPGGMVNVKLPHLLRIAKLLGVDVGKLALAIVNHNKPKGEHDALHS